MTLNVDYIEQRWIPELRSGRHAQCKEYLNNGIGKCCLGVLADLLIQDGVLPDWERYSDAGIWVEAIPIPRNEAEIQQLRKDIYFEETDPELTIDYEVSELPDQVATFIGLQEDGAYTGYLYGDGDALTLIQLNDERGFDFEQIADELQKLVDHVRNEENDAG